MGGSDRGRRSKTVKKSLLESFRNFLKWFVLLEFMAKERLLENFFD